MNKDEYIERLTEHIESADYIGDAQVATLCTNCQDEVVLLKPKLASFSENSDGFKKGTGECPACGFVHVPNLSFYYPDSVQ